MKKKDILIHWLASRERTYAGGVAIFDKLARPVHKEKYSAYFAQVEEPGMFDPHFTQLIDVLTKISLQIRNEPHLYPDADAEEIPVQKTMSTTEVADVIQDKNNKIKECKEEIADLQGKIESMEGDSEDHADEIYTLKNQLNSHSTMLADLEKQVSELSKPGIKIVKEADLPKTIKAAYDRIKEIAPLYGALHNDIANESISDEERKKYAAELCNLDDERRKLWDKIDFWSENNNKVTDVEETHPEYSDNAVVRGFELLRARKRLKENILNSQKSAKIAQTDGKQVRLDNALKRIAKYEADLLEVETEIANAGFIE